MDLEIASSVNLADHSRLRSRYSLPSICWAAIQSSKAAFTAFLVFRSLFTLLDACADNYMMGIQVLNTTNIWVIFILGIMVEGFDILLFGLLLRPLTSLIMTEVWAQFIIDLTHFEGYWVKKLVETKLKEIYTYFEKIVHILLRGVSLFGTFIRICVVLLIKKDIELQPKLLFIGVLILLLLCTYFILMYIIEKNRENQKYYALKNEELSELRVINNHDVECAHDPKLVAIHVRKYQKIQYEIAKTTLMVPCC